jgi:hypothetical protein
MRYITFIILIFSCTISKGQSKLDFVSAQENYNNALAELKGMLEGNQPVNFKRAVFITENTYLDNQLNYNGFNNDIQRLVGFCKNVIDQGGLIYEERDKEEVKKYWSVYMVMKQLKIAKRDSSGISKQVTPFGYDFDDFWGEQDWTKMFVSKLIKSTRGNCHSLPFLYKILCDELNAKAYLAMAPSHIYIKHYTKKDGWFNTELTSGQFPIDAWIMASGYVHLSAIQNGIYMDTLSTKQAMSLCVIDLAKGYERKFGKSADPNFMMQCAEIAINYYPNYVNALIMKAETMKKSFEKMMASSKAEYPSDILNNVEAKTTYDNMEKLYFHIYKLGYRAMPREMYISWLDELNKEREKYTNKDIVKDFNPSK